MIKKYTTDIVDTSIETPKMKPRNKFGIKIGPRRLFLLTLIVLTVAGLYGSVHYYNKYQALTIDPKVAAEKETARLVGTLGELMELPKGETPTVATISDKEKLKGQLFFSQAENGDILFAYTTSMKAILYRPSTNKIINVAPISINQTQDLTEAAKTTSSSKKK